MSSGSPYSDHISGPSDLVTTYEEKRAGFLALAFEKSIRMTPLINQANALREAAKKAETPEKLLDINSIQYALLKAAGVSDKANTYMKDEDRYKVKLDLINNYLKPAGSKFIDELVYRFLLTQGDALGGIMRNVGGVWGKVKFLDVLRATLHNSGMNYEILSRHNKAWQRNSGRNIASEETKAIRWWRQNGKNERESTRTLVVDFTVKIVGKNVDACLFKGTENLLTSQFYQEPNNFIALGELKGGIDPAGADEHWKTGSTALQRIRVAFSKRGLNPYTFFVGAAIESDMANEMWNQLEGGLLTNAANLTKANHMEALCLWILSL
jgi:hypothetical protein